MADRNDPPRPGEERLGHDPAAQVDAGVTFIGRLRSGWARGTAPRNLTQARASGEGAARIELAAPYRRGLAGLEPGQCIWVLYWMDQSRRDLIVQAPRHGSGPRGTFALRSPARPNPVAMAAVRITDLDPEAGVIGIDAIDAFDGTPVIDIKPWLDGIDIPPGAAPAP
ncbi:tRNA (N6-threonylcarbamoyladenosine(37)-N6)-methyltransferase TrmO [Pseudodonghicola flavimaris]|uniref:tRNA (N6-threonylcarbamoyladenosine(37)-N6)-methyltransferase TrmO n=1 Tax=Pseudodonghicola flavimaris TaxID=3050036 RepID=A0ABT7F6I5_9RHOB|nr:tRNA (N6-threonylcarbamoyladenosine(37)-N6)-methyltransferase TrmO [Pseudodonghicola flavimaris]MDK3020221.1 tRNA (N6-threonylcarbamoyladenosine(37)-N6)-methyltransferase TrmO [Pseudodonghicola flavimaris]